MGWNRLFLSLSFMFQARELFWHVQKISLWVELRLPLALMRHLLLKLMPLACQVSCFFFFFFSFFLVIHCQCSAAMSLCEAHETQSKTINWLLLLKYMISYIHHYSQSFPFNYHYISLNAQSLNLLHMFFISKSPHIEFIHDFMLFFFWNFNTQCDLNFWNIFFN